MNSSKIRFLYFLEYWPIPFGVLQTCCKIQKYKKIMFVVFKKSMRKHIFETSNIFLYIKKRSKHVRVLAVCNTQKYFYIFLSKTQASQLIAIKDNKPCVYILKIYKKIEQSKKSRMPLEVKHKLFFLSFKKNLA
jgi:hypothetical protein